MKIIDCPLNGPRNAQEFVYGGELDPHPNPHLISDDEWAEYIFIEENRAGNVSEWWCHVPTAYWFIVERDTVRDEIIRTFDPSEIFKERIDFLRPQNSDNQVNTLGASSNSTSSSIKNEKEGGAS